MMKSLTFTYLPLGRNPISLNRKHSEMTTSLTKLQLAALHQFAERGFDAASLSRIAEETGIKKPSIYAHFKGKEELYLSLIQPSIEKELDYTKKLLLSPTVSEQTFYGYLESFRTRLEESSEMRFLLRAMFLPPESLYQTVMKHVGLYVARMEEILSEAFTRITQGKKDCVLLSEAFFGIIGSLQAEILYGTEADFNRRLNSMWAVFKLALSTPTDTH